MATCLHVSMPVDYLPVKREKQTLRQVVRKYRLQCSRLVDIIVSMTTQQKPRQDNRQIVGFSLSPDMARDVKSEAGRRGVSLRKLFEEMWAGYKTPPKP